MGNPFYSRLKLVITKMIFNVLVHDPRLHSKNILTSGGRRTRTDDPRLAKPMLSQLSYTPIVLFYVYQM